MVECNEKLHGYVDEKRGVFYEDHLPNPEGLTPVVNLSVYATLKAENERLTKQLAQVPRYRESLHAARKHAEARAEAAERALAERAGGVKVKVVTWQQAWREWWSDKEPSRWLTKEGVSSDAFEAGFKAALTTEPAAYCSFCDLKYHEKRCPSCRSTTHSKLAAPQEPDFASTIAALIKDECEGGAAAGWRSCTGCHETNEGYETGRYPYSPMFGCHVGHGCSECGGLGVTWEYWSESDLEAMARDAEPAAPEGLQEAVAWIKPEVLTRLRDGRAAAHVDLSKVRGGGFTEPLYTREQAVTEPEKLVSEIEERFPNWRSYRDLIDCIDVTLADLRRWAR